MSGGHFDYKQYILTEFADGIEHLIVTNEKPNEYGEVRNYPPAILAEFAKAVKTLREAHIYMHRIDWLVSGDDGVDCFRMRLEHDLIPFKEGR